MKLTSKICHKVGIVNAYDYAGGHPFLFYSPEERGRGYRSASWCVFQAGRNFGNHWTDNGSKKFHVYEKVDKPVKLDDAIQWMKERFGYVEIVKTPIGSWMEKSFVEQRNNQIVEKYRLLKSNVGA